jgi:tetratricopeptide (TPR) repeat protein/transcriptional regulator with XRE-family HTH domain
VYIEGARVPSGNFGELLRRLRHEARLTQEELAEAAGISTRSVSDTERGINATVRKDTARRLADALKLAGTRREEFEAAALGWPSAPASAPVRTLPRDPASFTGRDEQLQQLVDAAADAQGVVEIYAIGGMAGVGKSALAIHSAYQVAGSFPDGQLFLPLHGHTPGQVPVTPRDALGTLLLAAGVAAPDIPADTAARTATWRAWTVGKRFLVILDDAVSSEQVRPLVPGAPGSLVIVTGRRRLMDLEDSRVISLDALPLPEAALLFARLADRPGPAAQAPETEEVAGLCGCLPLAIGLQARRLHHHPTWTVADLAAELRAERDRLALATTQNLPVGAAFRMSYAELAGDQQRLFRELGLHPGTELDAYAAAALDGSDLAAARERLDGLYDHYLLTEFERGRYRMHDLIREYSGALAATTDSPSDRDAWLAGLFGYYVHTARAADVHLARRAPSSVQGLAIKAPAWAPDLPTQGEAVAWMRAERLNLDAVVEYAAKNDLPRHAIAIAAAMHGFLRTQGHWDQGLAMHETALHVARQQVDVGAEAGALTDLGDMQYMTGDYPSAARSLDQALELSRSCGNLLSEAEALKFLSFVQYERGDRSAAVASLSRALECFRGLGNRAEEASTLGYIAVVQHANGQYAAAAANQEQALAVHRELGDRYGEANALNFLGAVQEALGEYAGAAANEEQALKLHRELGNRFGEANALHWLGCAQQGAGDDPAATASQQRALELYRELGYRMGEANVLNRMGSLAVAAGDYPGGGAVLQRALTLFQDLGILQGEAEVLNTMGELALADGREPDARSCHERALGIADGIDLPPEQARASVGLAHCSLHRGDRAAAASGFRRALAIYQQFSPVSARHIEEILRTRDL